MRANPTCITLSYCFQDGHDDCRVPPVDLGLPLVAQLALLPLDVLPPQERASLPAAHA